MPGSRKERAGVPYRDRPTDKEFQIFSYRNRLRLFFLADVLH